MTFYLNRIKRALIIVSIAIMPIYVLLKFFIEDTSDTLLNLLVITGLILLLGIYGIKSIEVFKVDKEFYKRPTWLLAVYLIGSLSIFFLCFEVLEILPKFIRINLYVSVVLFFLYPIFWKKRNT